MLGVRFSFIRLRIAMNSSFLSFKVSSPSIHFHCLFLFAMSQNIQHNAQATGASTRSTAGDILAGQTADDAIDISSSPSRTHVNEPAAKKRSVVSDVWEYFDIAQRQNGTVPCKKCSQRLVSKEDNSSGMCSVLTD